MKEGKEKLEIEINDIVADSILSGKQLTISELKEKISNLDWITYTEDSGENAFNVITDKDCIYEITQDENGKYIVIEQGKNNGEPWPTISLEQLPTQGNADEKVQIKVIASVVETSKTKKVDKVINNTTGEEKKYASGGIIFEVSQNGTYEFEAVADNGKTRRAKITINVESGDIIKISAEPTTPRNTDKTEAQNGIETGPIKVSITFGNINLSNTDKYQYRIGKEGSWQTATEKNVEIDVTENAIIVAKYYDGKNSIGAQNYSIQNVDNVAPDEFTPTVTTTTNSIKVTATTEDTASEGASSTTSGVEKWKYSIDNGSSWQDSGEFTGLTIGSYTIKVKAIDKAGNERIAEVSTQTEELTGGTISIVPDVTTPRNTDKTETQNGVETGPITVTITYGETNLTNADRYQYKIGSGEWQTSSDSTVSFTITENVSIASRYYDGKNSKDGTTYTIKNVDNEAPNSFTATATSTANSITLSGTTTDVVSTNYVGDTTLTYKYSKDGSSWQTSNTITDLAQNTTYTGYIKAIDKAGNERIATTSVTTKKLFVTVITAENYGDKVNYSAGGIDDWKIFYKDESNVFLITSDVVNNYDNTNMAQMIQNAGMTRYSDDYKYSQRWETVPTEKAIDTEKAKKFKLSYTDTTNNNMKCISRLMDSNTWNPLVDITKADSAIGTPTLEMWIDSWNSKYGIQIHYSSTNSIGYYVGEVANPDGTVDLKLETKEGYNDELYFPHKNVAYLNNNLGYIFAAPSASSTDRIVRVWWYQGFVGTALYNDSSSFPHGIRPVVQLKSTVTAIKDDTTGIWILQ